MPNIKLEATVRETLMIFMFAGILIAAPANSQSKSSMVDAVQSNAEDNCKEIVYSSSFESPEKNSERQTPEHMLQSQKPNLPVSNMNWFDTWSKRSKTTSSHDLTSGQNLYVTILLLTTVWSISFALTSLMNHKKPD